MIVIADTSALNYLVLLGHISILPALYGQVAIPHAVRDEMLAEGAPAGVRRWAAQPPEWLNVVSARRLDPTLPDGLGAGEREAISVALELSADVLLMDDQSARLAAEQRGLFVSGALSVLVQASRLGLVEFETSLHELKRPGFRVSEAVEALMRALVAQEAGN